MYDISETLKEGGSHIWLRYATQFEMDGRKHTIEIGIPVPVGASEETRERLIQEAEAGIEQLSTHVRTRISQMLHRSQQTPGAVSLPRGTTSSPTRVPPRQPATPPAAPQTATRPAGASSAPLVAQVNRREEASVAEPGTEHGGKSQPAPAPVGTGPASSVSTGSDANGNMNRQQFIQRLKEDYSLTPRQAMDMLKVKTLDGLNLRDALKQIQQLMAQQGSSMSTSSGKPQQDSSARQASKPSPTTTLPNVMPRPTTQNTTIPTIPISTRPVSSPLPKKAPLEEIPHAVIHDEAPSYSFDEEENLDDEEEYPFEELTVHEREIGEKVLNHLRATRGSTPLNQARLKVLENVIGDQISTEDLEEIIQGVWGVTSVKKLKAEQADALISWAKTDDFVGEAEFVLALLQEG